MAKGRKAQAKRTLSSGLIGGIVIALLVVGGIAVLAMRNNGDVITSEREYIPVSSFSDVHGLAVNPENPREIYVATHHGLIRGLDDKEWARVGSMSDDLMGFSMHPKNGSTFWTSGHPRGGGNMGVRQSTDDGFTWRTTWNDRVDFHAMTVSPAEPNILWGSYGGKLYQSTDAGVAWSVVNPSPPPMRAIAAHPTDASTVYATVQGGVSVSTDSGRTWTSAASIPAFGIAVDPTNAQTIYAGGQNALWKSTDGGETWASLQLPRPGTIAYLSVSRADPSIVYAASYEAGLYKTSDAGATWALVKAPER